MKKKVFLIIFLLISFVIVSNEQNIFDIVDDFTNYNFNPSSSAISRVSEPPDFIVAYFKRINLIKNYQKYNLTDLDKNKIAESIELLPEYLKSILKNNTIGIYFFKNLKSSAIIKYIKDKKNNLYFIIGVNADNLNNNISNCLSAKKNTCFIDDSNDYSIELNIGNDYFAFFYLLVHELSHAYGFINGITPKDPSSIKEIKILKNNIIMKEIWDNYYKPTKENDFKLRKYIGFYGKNNGPNFKNNIKT